MDTGSQDELELGFLDIFNAGSPKASMDLDGLGSLSGLDDPLLLHAPSALMRVSGPDLVATALRTHDEPMPMPLAFDGADTRSRAGPTHSLINNNNAAHAPAAAPSPAAPPAVPAPASTTAAPTFTIRPMPARKTQTSLASAAAAAVKSEPADAPAPPQAQQHAQQTQQVQQQQQVDDGDAATALDSDSDAGTARGGNKRRKRIRNAKQQELNRLAQQRYRERRKNKFSCLEERIDELTSQLGSLSTLEAANGQLQAANGQLEGVVKEQQVQLQAQRETITRQAGQLQTQAEQLSSQARQMQEQVAVIQQQDRTISELRGQLAASSSSRSVGGGAEGGSAAAPAAAGAAAAAAPDAEQLNEQIALAMRAVLTGVTSMASLSLPAKDAPAAQMQHMVAQLPDALLQQIRSCCREVALHLKKTEVKEQPHAISVPCC